MILEIRFDPAAREEFDDARRWHEQRRSGLGLQFAIDFDNVLTQAQMNPERFPRHHKGTRRCLLSRFLWLIVFRTDDAYLTVVAVFHGSRRPSYWHKRIK